METVMTAEQALCHLFFHFSRQDGTFDESEIDFIAAKTVALGFRPGIDFKKEVTEYIQSRQHLIDNMEYLEYLISILKPINTLALFSWCIEISLMETYNYRRRKAAGPAG